MPSRYYNPRLAKNLADAYKQEVYDFATPVERAFQPFIQMTERRYQEKLKEKEKYERQKEKIQAEQNQYFKNMAIVDPKKLDPSIRDYATQDMFNKQQEYRYVVENYEGYDRIKRTTEINNSTNYWQDINGKLSTYQQEYIDRRNPDQEGGDRTSKVNNSVTLEMDRRKANKEFDEVISGEDGRLYAVFNPQEDSAIEEPVLIAFDEWDNSYVPVERQTKKYVDSVAAFDKMIAVAKKELRWEDDPTNNAEIESTLTSIEFNRDEALSIAVDYLGMEPEEYAGTISADLDDDGIPGTIDDVNHFVKENLRQGALTQLTNLRKAYEDNMKATKTTELTASQVKENQRVENYTYVGDKLDSIYQDMIKDYPDIIKNQVNWIGTETENFVDLASSMGFSGFVSITDDNDNKIAVEVTNDKTNDRAYIPVRSGPEDIIKRLMIAAGATPREADLYYLEKFKNQTLPGLK